MPVTTIRPDGSAYVGKHRGILDIEGYTVHRILESDHNTDSTALLY